MRVTLYTKPDCPLCDDALRELHGLQTEFGFALLKRNILEDEALFTQFRSLIPVVDVEGGPLLYPPHDWYTLRCALIGAQAQRAAHDNAA